MSKENTNKVTFETKCWENDWKLMLQSNHLQDVIKRCKYDFQTRILYINNVTDIEQVKRYADAMVSKDVIDKYYIVDEYAEKAMEFFDLTQEALGKGYYYSIAELVSIYLCETKYLLHFSSDSYIKECENGSWIDEAISIMENDSSIVVANPTWNYQWKQAEMEANDETGRFYISQGFSDQCYLINTEIFKNKIYNFKHEDSERYPKYGGELFEKRADSFLRCNDKYRLTCKDVSYVSKNISKFQIFKEKILGHI